MKIGFLITLLTIASPTIFAQTADSVTIKKRLERQEKARRQRDSLETIFNATPPIFKIALELNHEKTAIPDNATFYATDGQRNYESKKSDLIYQFDSLPDSVKFTLQFDSIKLTTGFIKRRKYEHGGSLTFGYYDNVLELRKKWEKNKNDWDFDEWTDIRSPYLTAIKDKRIIRLAKRNKIGPIEFIVYVPRVYGDATVTTFQTIRPK